MSKILPFAQQLSVVLIVPAKRQDQWGNQFWAEFEAPFSAEGKSWELTAGCLHIRIGSSANPAVYATRLCHAASPILPHTFEENIAAEKAKLEAQAANLKPGPQRDGLLKKIRQLQAASRMNEWLSSPGLQSPN